VPDVLSDAAFARARELVGDALPERPGSSCRLQFDAGTRWGLVVEDGRVTTWQPGDLADAEAELRWSPEDAAAVLSGRLEGDEAHRRTTLSERAKAGDYVGPPPPMDLAGRAELQDLPELPAATVLTQYRFRSGPFGAVDYWVRWEDGRVTGMDLGLVEDHDVRGEVTFRAMARVRDGSMTIIEALEDGSVDGKIGPMALLAGVSEGREWQRAERAGGPAAGALATLGELREVTAFREACAALVEEGP
jgi:hypothetical protein